MNPASILLFALTHLFDIILSRQGARFCDEHLDRFQQMRLRLEHRHLIVAVKEVEFLEPVCAPACVYRHSRGGPTSLPRDHFRRLAKQLSSEGKPPTERRVIR